MELSIGGRVGGDGVCSGMFEGAGALEDKRRLKTDSQGGPLQGKRCDQKGRQKQEGFD